MYSKTYPKSTNKLITYSKKPMHNAHTIVENANNNVICHMLMLMPMPMQEYIPRGECKQRRVSTKECYTGQT